MYRGIIVSVEYHTWTQRSLKYGCFVAGHRTTNLGGGRGLGGGGRGGVTPIDRRRGGGPAAE
jgi:hypothetical protein